MLLNQDINQARYQIKAYEATHITVNEEVYRKSLIVRPETLWVDWAPSTVTELTLADFESILSAAPSILLLGTGAQLQFPDAQLLAALQNHGIGIECMDTRRACYTYTVLSAEQRDVAAALLLPTPPA